MIKAVIFDCFGVVYKDNLGEAYAHFGGDIQKDGELIGKIFFDASKGTIPSATDVITKHLGIRKEEWEGYQAEVSGFNEELLVYIDELRESYKVSMLSNIGKKGLVHHMDYSVLERHFDDVVESYKVGFAKPEARVYEIAADRLGVRLDECVFIDDREHYLEGATHVGMQTILYKDFKSFKNELERALS